PLGVTVKHSIALRGRNVPTLNPTSIGCTRPAKPALWRTGVRNLQKCPNIGTRGVRNRPPLASNLAEYRLFFFSALGIAIANTKRKTARVRSARAGTAVHH